MTKWFYDTEFSENGYTIDLISIALVSDDGREYYAVSNEFDEDSCSDWVKQNVLPHLPPCTTWKSRYQIAAEIRMLLTHNNDKPELWAYFADYDHVALCQLYGRMIDLPPGFPMFTMDLKQLMVMNGIQKDQLPKQDGAAHDALADARWVRDAFMAINKGVV